VVAASTGEILVPLAAEICRRIDVVRRRIEIDPPEGLLDLNVSSPRPGPARGR
jgi:ribosomal 30S subunit maturation factor RimM